MTISSTTRRAGPYSGNDSTTEFSFAFKVFAESDIQVFITDASITTEQTLDVDYSVALNADQDESPGGTITYPLSGDPLAEGLTLDIQGDIAYTQPAALPSGGNFSPRVIENALDRLTMQTIQLSDALGLGDIPGGVSLAGLPNAAGRAGLLLGFDEEGEAQVVAPVSGSAAALALALASSTGANQVGFLPAGTGAVTTRSVQSKLRETVSVADFGVVGSGDETVKVQAAVDSFAGTVCVLDLAGLSISITTVTIPNGKAFTVRGGAVTVTGSGSMGFSKTTLAVAMPARDMVFDNVHFTRAVTGGACVRINLAWQDYTGGIIVLPNCSFTLTNGAVGVRLSRSFGNSIGGRYTMDAGSGAGTSTAILCDASEVVAADAAPSCPFESIVDNAFFAGGIAFDQALITASAWNSFEGFSFGPGCRFYASQFKAKKYNSLKLTSVHGVSWKAIFDSGVNTSIVGGYFDRGANGDWMFKFLTTIRDAQGIVIGGGATLSAQGTTGDMVVFSDAGTAASKQITNVVFGTMYFAGGVNSVGSAIRGIKFDHNSLGHFTLDGSQSFQNLYACLSFTQAINRSVIRAFDARDITYYAENVVTGYGSTAYNRFDGIYRQYTLNIMVPTYVATASIETVHNQLVTFDNMVTYPVATISAVNSYFGAGYFTITAPTTYRNACEVDLVKNVAAPGATRGGCGALLTLDASAYIAPL